MAIVTGILPDDLGSITSRKPLQPRSSSPILSMPKRIRRKNSFVRRPDSSEDYPSPHDSIYEAVYISATNSDSSGNRIELIDIPPRRPGTIAHKGAQNDENMKTPDVLVISSIEQIEFRYGWGTPLETITEKRSSGTIRTIGRTKSADDLPNAPFLGHRDNFTLARNPRRKASFSFDDLILVQKSYHEACATIERQTFKLPIDEVYAEPKSPVRAPPDRPPTPEGMPSWTASQNMPIRPIPPRPVQNVFQRFFGLPASGITLSSRIPQTGTNPHNRFVSAPVRDRMAPRFRPPRSAYAPIDQHPFANAPVAQVKTDSQAQPAQSSQLGTTSAIARPKKAKTKRKLQRVRFTPSATARDSEMLNLQAAIESTTSLAIHPLATPFSTPSNSVGAEASVPVCPHQRLKAPINIAANIDSPVSTPANGLTLPPATGDHRDVTPNSTSHARLTVPNFVRNFGSSQAANSSLSLVTDDPRSRTTSHSSTAWLMSGGLRSPSGSTAPIQVTTQASVRKPRKPFCWRCACGQAGEKICHWWKSSVNCLCFVCCGYDLEEDVTTHNPTPGYPGYRPYSQGNSSQDYFTARRLTSDQHPPWLM
jgi:hypothetical protein